MTGAGPLAYDGRVLKGWGDAVAGPAALLVFCGVLWVFFAFGPTVPEGQGKPTWWWAVVVVGGPMLFLVAAFGVAVIRGWQRRRRLMEQEFTE